MKPTNRIKLKGLNASSFPSPKQISAAISQQQSGPAHGIGLVVDGAKAKGPRLTVLPILDRIFISSPEDENFDPSMEGGIHLPGGAARKLPGYTIVTVEGVGPDVKGVAVGDRVFVLPAACQQIVYESQHYYWLPFHAVGGIVK